MNLQADYLMSRISVSDIPAYRPFIRRMSVSDKLTRPHNYNQLMVNCNGGEALLTWIPHLIGSPFKNVIISELAGIAIHVHMRRAFYLIDHNRLVSFGNKSL